MLRYNGMQPAHFKGMTFGNANRWQGPFVPNGDPSESPFSPLAIWQLWDDFHIDEAVMHGWWLGRERGAGAVPVTSSRDGVKVTCFVRRGVATLLAIAFVLLRRAMATT